MEILCFGEALIDFKSTGTLQFQGYEGGSPYNVAIAAARLGKQVGFSGSISTDIFGMQLKDHLQQNNVDITLIESSDAPSTLAFVTEIDGDAYFSYYNTETADTLYNPQPRPTLPASLKAICMSSVCLINPLTGTAIRETITAHKKKHGSEFLVFYDPNVRPTIAKTPETYFESLNDWLALCDICKVSVQDVTWLYPDKSIPDIVSMWHEYVDTILVTNGENGVTLFRKDKEALHVPSIEVEVKDTVAAGDTFSAATVFQLLQHKERHTGLDSESWQFVMRFAARAAAYNCTQHGANLSN